MIGSTNYWNIAKNPGTNIVGDRFFGGNFWHDYAGQDLDGDGLGDTLLPYNSSQNISVEGDFLPLVPDSDHDGIYNTLDICILNATNNCLEGGAQTIFNGTNTTLITPSENVNMTIPSGTVDNGTIITILTNETTLVINETTATNITINNTNFAIGNGTIVATYKLESTTQLKGNVTIVFAYNESLVANETLLDIYWFNSSFGIWEAQNAQLDIVKNTLTITIDHFSEFAVIEVAPAIEALFPQGNEIFVLGEVVELIWKSINVDHYGIWYTTSSSLQCNEEWTLIQHPQHSTVFNWEPDFTSASLRIKVDGRNSAQEVITQTCGKEFMVTFRSDVNRDCSVDVADLASVGQCFLQSPSGVCELADLSNDNTINILDLAEVGVNFGKMCQ